MWGWHVVQGGGDRRGREAVQAVNENYALIKGEELESEGYAENRSSLS